MVQLCEMPFVKIEKAIGMNDFVIMVKHILPNLKDIILSRAALSVSSAIMMESSLSFLGLGSYKEKSWGLILHYAFYQRGVIRGYYWWYLPPIICTALAALGFMLLGYYGTQKRRERNMFDLKDVTVCFQSESNILAVDHVSLSMEEGSKTAIIGETGSGKSVLLLAILGLLPKNAAVSGNILLDGEDLLKADKKRIREIRGGIISYVPQGGGASMNPLLKVGFQVGEPLMEHRGYSEKSC